MRLIATIEDSQIIRRLLAHPRAPAGGSPASTFSLTGSSSAL